MKKHAPITGEQIAEALGVSRPTIRSDLSVLVMLGVIDAKPKVGYYLGQSISTDSGSVNRLRQIKVKEIMGRPIAISESGSVNDAVIQLFVENTGLLVVVDDNGYLTGVLSMKDLLKITVGNPNAGAVPIRMAMTRLPRVATISPEASVLDAAKTMIENQIGGLPVVISRMPDHDDKQFEVVGRITKTNILQVLLEHPIDA